MTGRARRRPRAPRSPAEVPLGLGELAGEHVELGIARGGRAPARRGPGASPSVPAAGRAGVATSGRGSPGATRGRRGRREGALQMAGIVVRAEEMRRVEASESALPGSAASRGRLAGRAGPQRGVPPLEPRLDPQQLGVVVVADLQRRRAGADAPLGLSAPEVDRHGVGQQPEIPASRDRDGEAAGPEHPPSCPGCAAARSGRPPGPAAPSRGRAPRRPPRTGPPPRARRPAPACAGSRAATPVERAERRERCFERARGGQAVSSPAAGCDLRHQDGHPQRRRSLPADEAARCRGRPEDDQQGRRHGRPRTIAVASAERTTRRMPPRGAAQVSSSPAGGASGKSPGDRAANSRATSPALPGRPRAAWPAAGPPGPRAPAGSPAGAARSGGGRCRATRCRVSSEIAAAEGGAAGQQLVEQRAQREEVGAGVDRGRRGPARATWRGGCRAPRPCAVSESPRSPPESDGLGDAEVEDLGVAVRGDHHVLGLEIAMDEPGGMGRGEPLGDLARQPHGARRGGQPRRQQLAQRLAPRRTP